MTYEGAEKRLEALARPGPVACGPVGRSFRLVLRPWGAMGRFKIVTLPVLALEKGKQCLTNTSDVSPLAFKTHNNP